MAESLAAPEVSEMDRYKQQMVAKSLSVEEFYQLPGDMRQKLVKSMPDSIFTSKLDGCVTSVSMDEVYGIRRQRTICKLVKMHNHKQEFTSTSFDELNYEYLSGCWCADKQVHDKKNQVIKISSFCGLINNYYDLDIGIEVLGAVGAMVAAV
mmetsp:Transcript_12385/g.15036  ORF Transcript_12385/g.15036 Transcript_12385/m.15036 type:complete len:152 (+) Transcript_12385:235-690(+)